MRGKHFQIYGVHIPRKCIDSRQFYSCPSQLKTFCHHALGRRKLLISPGSILSKICFPPTAERGGGKYDLLYQNSVRKYEDDLKH